MPDLRPHLWWQRGVVYQIYPRSFQDADGDGVGDLPGIAQRLDYLEWLGVDAVWLSPIFPSPMADFGYDVSDYTGVHPLFGTMEDFDRLLDACHGRGLKLLLDLVPNHSSDRHPWFEEARSSRDSPKRDWYLWADPGPDGGPPNNWLSVFGGSAWEWDEATGQYYYHAFLKEQPDLNWRNPEVVEAMLDVMRFWFDKGVDGFRIDVLWHIIKDADLRDNPKNPDYREGEELPFYQLVPAYSTDQPEVHDLAAKMRRVADAHDGRVLIGEIYLPIEQLVTYYGEEGGGVHLPFNFHLITLPWDARAIDRAINEYEGALPEGAWPNWVLGNHDKSRIATRAGQAQAPVAAVLLLTLRGTPTMYYGDEIGMHDVDVPVDRMQDPEGERLGPKFSRDPVRTPMQWDASDGGGFTSGTPWLPLADDYRERNVEAQRADPDSLLSLYRRLLDLRSGRPPLAVGAYLPLPADGDVIGYVREWEGDRLLVALNLGGDPQELRAEGRSGTVVLGTRRAREGEAVRDRVRLGPNEAVVVDLE
ncbi:MAG: alpha-amylase family glycosyl hydrolase [Rhodothermales bacterium]|nr:alpha-amylase family glycosyl hydrolase [Rhodothermales bacterium]